MLNSATVQPKHVIDLGSIDTLVLAGGGNRCWWQAGLISALTNKGWKLPPNIVATSAGAGIAAAFLTTGVEYALAACKKLYAENNQIFHLKALAQLKLKFAHQQIYPAWLDSFMGDAEYAALQLTKNRLLVAVTHPAPWLGLTGSLILGSIAYLLDKNIAHSIHPTIPRHWSLSQTFYKLNDCQTAKEARLLLAASAAAAPFMKAQKVAGRWGLDGGYTDNAPFHGIALADDVVL
jgi:predicted acylesterase/phospholipase RssA